MRASIAWTSSEGVSFSPRIRVKLDDRELTEGVDYQRYDSRSDIPGKAEVTIIGMGLYYGKITKQYEIMYEEPEPAEVEAEEPEAQAPEPAPAPVAPPEPPKPLDAAHAAFEAMLAESVPPLKPAFQNRPEKLLSRVFHAHYNRTDPVIFLVDGHNILNLGWTELSKERTNGLTHREVRELFVEKCKVLALGFPNSRTVVFFDGEDARQVPVTPNLVVEYSGNPEHIHEHRADRVIVGYAGYLHTQEKIDPWSLIVVSADQGLCADARLAGAVTIHHHRLFLDLLAACR